MATPKSVARAITWRARNLIALDLWHCGRVARACKRKSRRRKQYGREWTEFRSKHREFFKRLDRSILRQMNSVTTPASADKE